MKLIPRIILLLNIVVLAGCSACTMTVAEVGGMRDAAIREYVFAELGKFKINFDLHSTYSYLCAEK